MMEITQVSKESVDVYWNKVKNWIHEVVKQSHGRHSLFTTYELLKKGTMTMFLVTEKNKLCAVYVVQTIYYPAKIVLGILFCGGSKIIKNVKQIENFFIQFAKKNNCEGLEIMGRKGWDRVIKNNNLNFKKTGFFYEMAT